MQQRHLPDGSNHFKSCKLSEIQHDLNRNGGSDGSHYWLKINFWYDITDSKPKLTYTYWLWHKQWWTWLPRCCWWWPWSAMHSSVEHMKKLYPKIKWWDAWRHKRQLRAYSHGRDGGKDSWKPSLVQNKNRKRWWTHSNWKLRGIARYLYENVKLVEILIEIYCRTEVDDKRIVDVDQIEYSIQCVSQKKKKDQAF